MLDSALFITILVIFSTTIVAALVAARQRDPCLRQWQGYLVRLDLTSGERFEGRIRGEISGFEITFPSPSATAIPRYSRILYRDEYDDIEKLVRFLDTMAPEERRRRDRALRHAYHPRFHRRWARTLRNWLNTVKDAVADAVSVVAGHAGMKSQAGRAKQTGATLAGAVGRAYDPLLERLIGRPVVVTLDTGEAAREYGGLFREYSGVFLAIVDVSLGEGDEARTADLLLPRPRAILRYSAQPR